MTGSRDTICALSSAPGKAGVAVVRVSGLDVRRCLEAMAGGVPRPRRAVLRTIRDPSSPAQDIDQAIVLFFAGPSSFTGEDVAELHLHGGRAVVAKVLMVLISLGCRIAEPGEFARRAFDAGKLDLAQAEGIADLIDAQTEAQRRQAMLQASGAQSRLYEQWRGELISALALQEAAIDFSDEADVAHDASAQSRDIVVDLVGRIRTYLDDGHRGEILRDGFRVVLAGPPNAGKSSLLNALARRDAAIVSPEPGTTRDVIEVRLDLNGLPVIVQDTAGIREGAGAVEQEGIRRTMAHGRVADLVLWLVDAGDPVWDAPQDLCDRRVLEIIVTKVDLARGDLPTSQDGPARSVLGLSSATGEGLQRLISLISQRASAQIGASEGPVITQARHRQALEDCVRCCNESLVQDAEQSELVAEDLRRAANALGRITGRIDAEDVLDQVFGRFCIGK